MIVISKLVFAEPPELFANNVYVTAVVWFTVGVPEITPFSIDKPAGKVGVISHVCTKPPVFETTISVIAVPRVKVWSAIAPRFATGSLIVIVTVVFAEPPVLLP